MGNGSWERAQALPTMLQTAEDMMARGELPEKKLVEALLQHTDTGSDPALQRRAAAVGMGYFCAQATALVSKYERQTRPAFVWGVILLVSLLAGGFLITYDPESGAVWTTIMCFAMVFVGLVLVPKWRRQIPVLHQAQEEALLAGAALQDEQGGGAAAATALDAVATLRMVLAKANYTLSAPEGLQPLLEALASENGEA